MKLPEDPNFLRLRDYISSRSRPYFAAETPFQAQQDNFLEHLDLQEALHQLPPHLVLVVGVISETENTKEAERLLVERLKCPRVVARRLIAEALERLRSGTP